MLVFEHRFGNSVARRIREQPSPRPSARAFQIDECDFAIGGGRAGAIEFSNGHHFPAPKRCFRLSSPVLSSAETIALTTRSGWLSGRNCERHSTTLPSPLGLTPSVPV